jgi:transposase
MCSALVVALRNRVFAATVQDVRAEEPQRADLRDHRSGQRIVRAILGGERDPATLAALSHPGIHATRDTIAKSLDGTWQPDLVFVLQQEVAMYDAYQQRIAECDHELEQHLKGFEDKVADPAADGEPSPTTPR